VIRSIAKLVSETGLKILIHGPAGAGKTVMCCTAGEPTLLISAESGLLSVKNAPKYIKAAPITCFDDLEDVYAYLKESAENPDFKWICLDSISEMAEQVLFRAKQGSLDPRRAYGEMQDVVGDSLRRFRDLTDCGYNVVMSCKQQRITDENGKSFFGPMMPGQKLHQQVPYLFDEVFALRVEKDKDGGVYRVVQTGRDNAYEAKDRSGMLDMFEPPNLKKIARKIKGEEKPEEKTEKIEVKEEVKEEEKVEETTTNERKPEEVVIESDEVETEEV
jgi:hypothetical protein